MKKSTTYYTYRHWQGYGREDHLANELIARAMRRLGLSTGTYIAASMGLLSHPVPMASPDSRMSPAPGIRSRMETALRRAKLEMACCWGRRHGPDCSVSVECYRERVVSDTTGGCFYSRPTRLIERRDGHRWVTEFSHTEEVEAL
jgi:hypothetical protein